MPAAGGQKQHLAVTTPPGAAQHSRTNHDAQSHRALILPSSQQTPLAACCDLSISASEPTAAAQPLRPAAREQANSNTSRTVNSHSTRWLPAGAHPQFRGEASAACQLLCTTSSCQGGAGCLAQASVAAGGHHATQRLPDIGICTPGTQSYEQLPPPPPPAAATTCCCTLSQLLVRPITDTCLCRGQPAAPSGHTRHQPPTCECIVAIRPQVTPVAWGTSLGTPPCAVAAASRAKWTVPQTASAHHLWHNNTQMYNLGLQLPTHQSASPWGRACL